jgi:L-alanine-DL-glutamate epimerase-like enolase superfamily enzyme
MKITHLDTAVFRFPTGEPEADGTLGWNATTAVVVIAHAGSVTGLGWTYSTGAAEAVIRDHLAGAAVGQDTADVASCWESMRRACRNLGARGLVMQAISAVDIALWDLKARTLDLPLRELLGQVRSEIPVYGSGGFTTMSDDALAEQVEQWKALGCHAMKIKIGESWGRRTDRDLARVRRVREVAPHADLMVDANGGYSRAQARRVGAALDELGVVWFEEPVSSDDIDGLAHVRDAVNCDVAAGEYAADLYDTAGLCQAVDCLQLDATRCGGYTGFAGAASLAAAHNLEVSAHCAPALHAPIAAATVNLRHVEYFADHARLEPLLVEHTPVVDEGAMRPNATVGHGLLLAVDADRWRA